MVYVPGHRYALPPGTLYSTFQDKNRPEIYVVRQSGGRDNVMGYKMGSMISGRTQPTINLGQSFPCPVLLLPFPCLARSLRAEA